MSASSQDVSHLPVGPIDPESLEAAPKAWYDDLRIGPVLVAAFISTVFSLATIFLAQGLYFHWESDEIQAKDRRKLISPGSTILAEQREMLETGEVDGTWVSKTDNSLYYQGVESRKLVPLKRAKEKVLATYGSNATE